MTQKQIDTLLFQRDKYFNYLERAKYSALQAVKIEDLLEKNKLKPFTEDKERNDRWIKTTEKTIKNLKASALGLYQEHKILSDKIDRISNHLYKTCWAVANSFGKEKVEKRRTMEQEKINKLKTKL